MKNHPQNQQFWDDVNAQQLAGVFNLIPELFVFAKDKGGRFTACSTALVKALGLSFENELLGKTDYDFFDTRLADAYREEDEQVMTTGIPVRDEVWHVPDTKGNISWFISTKTPISSKSGEVIGILGVMRSGAQAGSALSPYADMTPVLDYVAKNYDQDLRIPQLARIAHLSVSQFERRFRDLFAVTPAKYVIKVRLDAASHLLTTTDDTVSAIALTCGFYDHSHFSRLFQRTFNTSPTAYRKRYR